MCLLFAPLYSTFGALFLFVVSGLMRMEYRYIHIHGDLPSLSKPVTYAGFFYLVGAAISICLWVRGSVRARNASLASQLNH